MRCLFLLLLLPAFLALSGLPAKAADPMSLGQVRYWGYQIQDVNDEEAMDRLAESSYDMLVIEPTRTDWSSEDKEFDTAAFVERLKQTKASDREHRKLVIAYIDIGQAEDWRWYWTWSVDWEPGHPIPGDWPEYIMAPDPDGWGGNYVVAYWHEEWKDLVIYGQNQKTAPGRDYTSILDEVVRDGFDGVYLDWVEAFEDPAVIALAGKQGKDPAREMARFIQEMREYARQRAPGFIIIQQNASRLGELAPESYEYIDAIAQEEVWFGGGATDDWDDPQGHDAIIPNDLTREYSEALDTYLARSIPVFNVEYALLRADEAYRRSLGKGYIPYCTRRSLGRLTTTPPPGLGSPR